jgi:predicted RNA-binding protein with RPS1 domain
VIVDRHSICNVCTHSLVFQIQIVGAAMFRGGTGLVEIDSVSDKLIKSINNRATIKKKRVLSESIDIPIVQPNPDWL